MSAVAADQITVTDYNGATTVLPLGTGYSVIKNEQQAAQLGLVQAGDRVEVRKDTNGLVVVTVISGVSKEFWKFDLVTLPVYYL